MLAAKANVDRLLKLDEEQKKEQKRSMTSGEPVMLLSVHRTRSRRMEFCVHGGLGDTLNKQRRKLNGYPGALLASIIGKF